MKTNLIILGALALWLSACDFTFTNPLEDEIGPEPDTAEGLPVDTDAGWDTDYESKYPGDSEYHTPLYMQEDPSSPGEVNFAYQGVDILLIVDNSMSMQEEQGMFSTALFDMVNALNNSLPDWPYPAVPLVNVGVATTDMGLVYGPNDALPMDVQVAGCGGRGDAAQLQVTDETPIDLTDMSITCNGLDGSGCPQDWTCIDDNSNGIGVCAAPGGDTQIECPELTNSWGQEIAVLDGSVPSAVACAASVGISGCGIEQQLKVAPRAVELGLEGFVREGALLAVFLLTDEDDCSIASDELFATDEFSNHVLKKLNVACNIHQGLLMPVAQIRDELIDLKQGDEHAVLFGALAGMPTSVICEGGGHHIDTCLDHDDMQFVETEDLATGQIVAQPACERYVDTTPVTSATPAHRIVSLVQEFQEYGYAYSICNDDYSGATKDFAKQILRALQPYDPMFLP